MKEEPMNQASPYNKTCNLTTVAGNKISVSIAPASATGDAATDMEKETP
jgi:hypothetical protein